MLNVVRVLLGHSTLQCLGTVHDTLHVPKIIQINPENKRRQSHNNYKDSSYVEYAGKNHTFHI